MNVYVLDVPFSLPRPDLEVVADSRLSIQRQAEALGDLYLPVLTESLGSLLKELSHADRQFLDILTLVPHGMDSEDIQPFMDAITQLKAKPEDAETRAALAEFNAEIDTLLQGKLMSLSEAVSTLDNALVNLDAVHFNDVAHLAGSLDKEVVDARALLSSEETSLTHLQEKEAAAGALITELEGLSFLDKLKPLVVSLEKLAEIDPASPSLGSIKAGIAGVANILNLIDGSLKYDQLLDHRSKLHAQVAEQREKVEQANARLKSQTDNQDQLAVLQSIDGSRERYVLEAGKLRQALQHFLDTERQAAASEIEARAEGFARRIRQLIDYLNDLRRQWRN